MRCRGVEVWGSSAIAVLALAAIVGCGEELNQSPEPAVAEVGDAVITVAEFNAFKASL